MTLHRRAPPPQDLLMKEEVFGPVLTAYVYADETISRTNRTCVSKPLSFALRTGSSFFVRARNGQPTPTVQAMAGRAEPH